MKKSKGQPPQAGMPDARPDCSWIGKEAQRCLSSSRKATWGFHLSDFKICETDRSISQLSQQRHIFYVTYFTVI
ncbi:MAG: hypothetical protein R3261_13115 [Alphaproteobacteria bacterium]|nr:hypothetical protein [Alphaproteobacteria bacterium]